MEKVVMRSAGGIGWRLERWLPLAAALVWLVLLAFFGGADMLAWGLRSAPQGALLLLSSALLYVVPGLAVLRYTWPELDASWPEKLAVATGIGIALPPLLLQLAYLVGLPWNTWTTIGYVIAPFVVLAPPALPRIRRSWRALHLHVSGHGLLLLGLLSLALLVRLYIVRDLPVGLWGDSYQHTMMAQLLVDNGGLFSSWAPYAPLVTFTYHYGFHANVAFFHWLTGVPVTQSLLIVGQIVNVVALTSAYVLTTRLTGNPWAGLWAVALAGFYNTQPVYYVNWGRYTQLTGQVILPIVLLTWMAALEAKLMSWPRMSLAAMITACLMLTHYIVTLFAALFLAAYVLVLLIRAADRSTVLRIIGRAALTGTVALVLAAPWLLNTLRGHLRRNVAGFVTQSVGAERIAEQANLVAITPQFLKGPLVLLAFAGLCIALRRRDWRTALLAVWSQLLILIVIPHVFGLPGSGVVNWFAAYIALYLTVVPLAAYALATGAALVWRWRPFVANVAVVVLLVGVSLWGVRWQQRLIDPQFQLFTQADAKAMQWIRGFTPANARFLVNMFPAFGNSLFAGSDGGWWIPLLTQRQTTLPPLTYGSEQGVSPDYAERVNQLGFALRELTLASDEAVELLREHGITHVYVGAQSTQPDRIDAAALRQHPSFQVVYEQDGVTIFALTNNM